MEKRRQVGERDKLHQKAVEHGVDLKYVHPEKVEEFKRDGWVECKEGSKIWNTFFGESKQCQKN